MCHALFGTSLDPYTSVNEYLNTVLAILSNTKAHCILFYP